MLPPLRFFSTPLPIAMADHPHHRFRKNQREWFRLLVEMGLMSEQEATAALKKLPSEPSCDEKPGEK